MHKVVIKGNYYGRTRTLPDLNDYLHECARHPQMGAKMKRGVMLRQESHIIMRQN